MFWRHFGCTCGFERGVRLVDEYPAYEASGLVPVVVTQAEPARAAAYREQHQLPCMVLCDPDHRAYRAYGIGQWPVERILFDAPAEYWAHPRNLGERFQAGRRAEGRPPVDDPWPDAYILGAQCVLGRRHGHPDTRLWIDTSGRLTSRSGMRKLTVRSLLH